MSVVGEIFRALASFGRAEGPPTPAALLIILGDFLTVGTAITACVVVGNPILWVVLAPLIVGVAYALVVETVRLIRRWRGGVVRDANADMRGD